MSKCLGSMVIVLLGIACGGTTDSGEPSGGGASTGGANGAGTSSGGVAGKATGGMSLGGSISVSGATGWGGSISTAGSVGAGGGTVDPRCPARYPTGQCSAEAEGALCYYEQFAGCLCYSTPGISSFCTKVDPLCPNSGAGGAQAAPPPADAGSGGISTKIALPPRQICSCVNGAWACSFGY
jgi:hypothetical protein